MTCRLVAWGHTKWAPQKTTYFSRLLVITAVISGWSITPFITIVGAHLVGIGCGIWYSKPTVFFDGKAHQLHWIYLWDVSGILPRMLATITKRTRFLLVLFRMLTQTFDWLRRFRIPKIKLSIFRFQSRFFISLKNHGSATESDVCSGFFFFWPPKKLTEKNRGKLSLVERSKVGKHGHGQMCFGGWWMARILGVKENSDHETDEPMNLRIVMMWRYSQWYLRGRFSTPRLPRKIPHPPKTKRVDDLFGGDQKHTKNWDLIKHITLAGGFK